VALETESGRLDFGGGVACVDAGAAGCRLVAETIARAVIGPRHRDVDGTIEIAGRYVALQSLPAPLLRPSAPATIDHAMFDEMWRTTSAQQRADLEAAHAQRRLERHRTDAAIERARDRANALAARAAAAPPVAAPVFTPVAPPAPVAPAPAPVVDAVTPVVAAMLDALDDLSPVPSPAAHALADAFDELNALVPTEPARPVDVDLSAAERRVADARVAVAAVNGGLLPQARARIESCHRTVVESERRLFEAGRKERPEALALYQAALAEERAALTAADVDSYASYLVTTAAGGAPVDLEARLRAELELAQAESALERGRDIVEGTSVRLHEEKELELRARAAQLLGRVPGTDPAAELRALRVEHPDAAPTRDALRSVLTEAGESVGSDVVADARAFVFRRETETAAGPVVATPAPAPQPVVPEPAPAPRLVISDEAAKEQRVVEVELQALLDERAAHEHALAALETRLEIVDGQRSQPWSELEVDSVLALVGVMLDRYRAAELLAGRLPLVVDGALDKLDPRVVALVANHLAGAHDIQTIVVTDTSEVTAAFASVGARTITWPFATLPTAARAARHERPLPAPVASASPPVPAPRAPVATSAYDLSIPSMCGLHPSKVSAAECAHCGRASCVDCLVYVPGETDLWCVACAEALRSRNLKLLRRRGA
jgi:hypothetical protein